MSMLDQHLEALLAKLKEDTGLQDRLKGATNLDAAVTYSR